MTERWSDEEFDEAVTGCRNFADAFAISNGEAKRARAAEKKWHDRLLAKIKLTTSFCDEREAYDNRIVKLEAENAELKANPDYKHGYAKGIKMNPLEDEWIKMEAENADCEYRYKAMKARYENARIIKATLEKENVELRKILDKPRCSSCGRTDGIFGVHLCNEPT